MNGASIPHEVCASPRVGGEERVREKIAFQAVTPCARENDVAGVMGAAVRQRVHVVERCRLEIELGGAVDAAPAAVAHGGSFDGALVFGPAKVADARVARAASKAGEAGEAGEHDAVVLSANGHFTSREKATPRDRRSSQRGASDHFVAFFSATNGTRHCRACRGLLLLLRSRRCRTSLRLSERRGVVAFAVLM